jgi:hypothetical protein
VFGFSQSGGRREQRAKKQQRLTRRNSIAMRNTARKRRRAPAQEDGKQVTHKHTGIGMREAGE